MSAVKRPMDREGDGGDEEQEAKRLRMDLKKPLRLLDLPLGPLHLIFSKVPLESQKLLRKVSKEMRDELNDFFLHNYKSFTHKLRNSTGNEANSEDQIILKVVEEATNYIIISGYVSSFMNNLPLFFQGTEDIDVADMQLLLHRCYHELEYSRRETSQDASHTLLYRRRLVYMVTLLNLLRQFRNFRKVNSCLHLMHWKLHIELKGIHISASHERTPGTMDSDKFIDFITMISELLVYDLTNTETGFSRYLDIGNSVYSYGSNWEPGIRGPRLDLHFSILAPLAVRTILENALDGKLDRRTAIECPLLDAFSIHLDIHNSGVNWIIKKNWQICILPLF